MYPVHFCFYPLFIQGLFPLADKRSNTSCCTNMSLSLCISHTDWLLSMKLETSKAVTDVYPLRSLNKGVCVYVRAGYIFLPQCVNVDFYSMFVMSLKGRVTKSSVNCGW